MEGGWSDNEPSNTVVPQLAYFHLNGKAVEFVDVENVLGCVANQESAANEKKHSTKAAKDNTKTS